MEKRSRCGWGRLPYFFIILQSFPIPTKVHWSRVLVSHGDIASANRMWKSIHRGHLTGSFQWAYMDWLDHLHSHLGPWEEPTPGNGWSFSLGLGKLYMTGRLGFDLKPEAKPWHPTHKPVNEQYTFVVASHWDFWSCLLHSINAAIAD